MNEELENNTEETLEVETGNVKLQFTTVTTFSKYLALALFVALPFIGGWIGYTFAPEKIVEVEKIVVKEVEEDVILENDDNNNVSETFSVEEVSYYPREDGPGSNDSSHLSWSSWSGRVNQVYAENEKLYLLVDKLEVYSGGGSCKSINGICVVNNDQDNTLLELADEAHLTLHWQCVDYEDDINYLPFEDRRIKEDGLGVETGCSVSFNSEEVLQLDDSSYFNILWFDFNEQGQVIDVVRQYFP
jgi:hypothetical protein